MPAVPEGSGAHPIVLVAIAANELNASTAFYSTVFGWQSAPMSPELTAMRALSGPGVSLRANVPEGAQTVVPYIHVSNIETALASATASGATVDHAPWVVPMAGTMARFRDASGTVYGVTTALAPDGAPRVPMPFGENPKPPVHSICSLEMYAAGDSGVGDFVRQQFGWGSAATMPQYVAFDPGAGIGGVFQSHTPVAPALAYIYVADVSATLTAIDAAGGKRMGDAMAMPGMATFGYFTDPSGVAMGLIGS